MPKDSSTSDNAANEKADIEKLNNALKKHGEPSQIFKIDYTKEQPLPIERRLLSFSKWRLEIQK